MKYFVDNDPEAATLWLFERMDDATLDLPLEQKQGSQTAVSVENIEMVVAMGFSHSQAKYALAKSVIFI